MALCTITGTIYMPNGEPAAVRWVQFVLDVGEAVEANYVGAVSPDPIRVRTDKNGDIDVELITGNYYGFVESRGKSREYAFRAVVPDAAAARFEDVIEAASPILPLPEWLQQALEARDEAEAAALQAVDAADRAEDAANSVDFRIYDTRADAVSAISGGFNLPDGAQFIAGGIGYAFKSGETAIADMPGVIPTGDITPQHFGAKGDGVSDDTSAIQAANDYGGSLYFPAGRYAANSITQTCSWDMDPDTWIVYNGPVEGEAVRCLTDSTTHGRIQIDCNGLEARTGYYINGSDNFFGLIRVNNTISTNRPWVVRSLYLTGSGNIFSVVDMANHINAGHTNDSSPQGFVIDGASGNNIVSTLTGKNIRTGIVNNSSGVGVSNYIGSITITGGTDNAYYGVNASHADIGDIVYEGVNSAAGFRHGSTASIGSIKSSGWGGLQDRNSALVFFGDCGDITIGEIFAVDKNHTGDGVGGYLLHSNLADAGRINIGKIVAEMHNTAPIYLASVNGTIDFLKIDNADITVRVSSAGGSGFSPASFIQLLGVKGLEFGDFRVRIFNANPSFTNTFYTTISPSLTHNSSVRSMRTVIYGATESDPPVNAWWGQNFIQDNLTISEGVFNANADLRPWTYGGRRAGLLTVESQPTAGYWRRGTVLWKMWPDATNRGWICTVAGAPGTWITF